MISPETIIKELRKEQMPDRSQLVEVIDGVYVKASEVVRVGVGMIPAARLEDYVWLVMVCTKTGEPLQSDPMSKQAAEQRCSSVARMVNAALLGQYVRKGTNAAT